MNTKTTYMKNLCGLAVILVVATGMTTSLQVAGPKSLNDRIVIVGAGPSGIHMALSLKERHFTNIVILERNQFVGGKSWTKNYRGTAHEMGSVYLAPDYAENVIPLVNKYTPGNLVFLPPSSVWLDDFPGPITYEMYLLRYTMTFFKTQDIMTAVNGLVIAIQKYIVVHNEIFGEYEGDLMPEPTPEVRIKSLRIFIKPFDFYVKEFS